jgi:hypothetical protein
MAMVDYLAVFNVRMSLTSFNDTGGWSVSAFYVIEYRDDRFFGRAGNTANVNPGLVKGWFAEDEVTVLKKAL